MVDAHFIKIQKLAFLLDESSFSKLFAKKKQAHQEQ